MLSGEIREVTPNVGFGLVDSGQATYVAKQGQPPVQANSFYQNRQMSVGQGKQTPSKRFKKKTK